MQSQCGHSTFVKCLTSCTFFSRSEQHSYITRTASHIMYSHTLFRKYFNATSEESGSVDFHISSFMNFCVNTVPTYALVI
jgi:hypothetical protein